MPWPQGVGASQSLPPDDPDHFSGSDLSLSEHPTPIARTRAREEVEMRRRVGETIEAFREREAAYKRAKYKPTGRRPGPARTQAEACVVSGCERPPLALSKCQKHYRAQRYAEGVAWARGGGKNNDRARARQHGVAYEPINRLEVYERDGWICGICGGAVEKDDASLDHVVPMSRGGAHLYSNVQCAHLLCNIRKGASHGDEAIDLPAPELAHRG